MNNAGQLIAITIHYHFNLRVNQLLYIVCFFDVSEPIILLRRD